MRRVASQDRHARNVFRLYLRACLYNSALRQNHSFYRFPLFSASSVFRARLCTLFGISAAYADAVSVRNEQDLQICNCARLLAATCAYIQLCVVMYGYVRVATYAYALLPATGAATRSHAQPQAATASHTQPHAAKRSRTQSHAATRSHGQPHAATRSHMQPRAARRSQTHSDVARRSKSQPGAAEILSACWCQLVINGG